VGGYHWKSEASAGGGMKSREHLIRTEIMGRT
jgi:hypothetical protein